MSMFDYDFVPSDNSDLGSVIAKIICEDPLRAARAAQRSTDAMTKIIRRSLGKTGSQLFRILKAGLKSNSFNLAPHQIYSKTGAVMSSQIKEYPHRFVAMTETPRPVRTKYTVGGKFTNLMQYFMNDKNERDISTLKIGMIPERRGGEKWARRFSDWQEAGDIKVNDFIRYSNRSMRWYFSRIGMPLKAGTILKRPARSVIERAQIENDPFEMFKKNFVERLSRGLR